MCETVTWSHSVNSEDFIIAETNGIQIQPSTCCDLPRDAPSRCKRQPRQHLLGELATFTDVNVLQMESTEHLLIRERRSNSCETIQMVRN